MERVLARRLLSLVPEEESGMERLIEKKRQSFDLQVELDTKKQQHLIKMAQFKAKDESLEQQNLTNQSNVVANDQYVIDNQRKRNKEEERMKSEEKLLETKRSELEELQMEHDELTKAESTIEKQLEASLPYKSYLDAVFEAAPEMGSVGSLNEVQGIVQKYKTLKEWRGALQVRLLRSKKELQRLRDAISVYDESSTNCTVEIDYQIKIIAQAQQDVFKNFGRERHMEESRANQSRAKATEASVIRLTIDNLFKKAQNITISRYRKGEKAQDNLSGKFSYIEGLITDMVEIEKATRPE